jgi:subtilisin family serine protease
MRRFAALPLTLAGLALSACQEQPLVPAMTRVPAKPSLITSGGPYYTGRHVISFQGAGEPAGFRQFVADHGGQVEWSSPAAGLAAVSGLTDANAQALAGTPGIGAVDADELIVLEAPQVLADQVEALADQVESPANPAAAIFFPRQWNLRQVQANTAWAANRLGSPNVSVYILDSGIDPSHLDLQGRVDGTRSVDLLGTFTVNGIPFTERDTVAKYFPGRPAYTDLFFHGTHVGATVSSNAVAAAGVTSMTRLVAVKVCAYLNVCPFSSILNGVIYAADNGADVVNMSLGGNFSKAGNGRFVGLINKTFNYARSRGVTIVVSAGNSAIDMDHDGNAYKTYCSTPATVCVAATGPTAQGSVNGPWTNPDAPATYTNFGRSAINVAAPGGNGNSFVWAACSRTSLVIPVCRTGTFIVGAQGTSMAAPHVSGAAALLVENLGRNPGLIRSRLQQTADNVAGNGTTPFYGKGRVNVARAAGVI